MHKKNKKLLIISSLAVLIPILIILYVLSPRPTVGYFVKTLNEIGITDGVNPVSAYEDIRAGGFGGSPYARRSYLGDVPFEVIKSDMTKRIKQAGFKNAKWREANHPGAAGIFATCKGMAIFVRVYQREGVPIDIEVFKASYPDAPSCPWL